MAKNILSMEERKALFLYRTSIENLFINEFMPDAPGDYVKVYLIGIMCAEYGQEMDMRRVSLRLGLRQDEVEEAWIYWESRGLVRRKKEKDASGEESLRIEFVSQVEDLYGKMLEGGDSSDAAETAAAEEGAAQEGDMPIYMNIDDMEFDEMMEERLVNARLKAIYQRYEEVCGRTVSPRETGKIEDAINVYGIEPDIFEFAIDYCADLGKDSIDYIFKVALRWTEENCTTVEEVKRLLEKHNLRNSWYGRVFKALGFNRLPAPADREIMDRWFDDMKCSIDEVIDACNASAGIREPNLRYVNKVIENRRLEKGGVNTRREAAQGGGSIPVSDGGSLVSRKVLADYFEYLRGEEEKLRRSRIEEVKKAIPGMDRLFEKENAINERLLSMKPGDGNLDMRQSLRVERHQAESEKKLLLEAAGYPKDYLNRQFRCDICRDTGYTDEGMVCSCCRERAEEAYRWIGEKNRANER